MLEAWHPLWHLTSFSTGGFSDCLRHGILDRSRASVLPPNFSIRICSDLLLHLHPWLHISKVTSAQSITAIFLSFLLHTIQALNGPDLARGWVVGEW